MLHITSIYDNMCDIVVENRHHAQHSDIYINMA